MTERLAISFWIWGLFNAAPNGFFDDLEGRVVELKERGFNCIRLEAGAGLCHDGTGRRRGELAFQEIMPGHNRFTRQCERVTAGRCDPLKRLLELCALARRYKIKLILSSWYFLHTFWFAPEEINAELLGLPASERFIHFARALDFILREIEDKGLQDVVAFAEILNEADGLDFAGERFRGAVRPKEQLDQFRAWHEEALEFLQARHPGTLFALDTCTPFVSSELMPRNAQVWNFHSYYLWPAYDLLDRSVDWDGPDGEPVVADSIRRWLRRDPVPYPVVRASRGNRPPLAEDWYHRIWLYMNLEPAALPELEGRLQADLEQNAARFKQKAEEAVLQAIVCRDRCFPESPLVLGEGTTYCADNRLRWEERSDVYWEVVEHGARICREHGLWGAVARTNSGPEDPVWHEYPERLLRVNEVFLGRRP